VQDLIPALAQSHYVYPKIILKKIKKNKSYIKGQMFIVGYLVPV
jgi:hypothetical protein